MHHVIPVLFSLCTLLCAACCICFSRSLFYQPVHVCPVSLKNYFYPAHVAMVSVFSLSNVYKHTVMESKTSVVPLQHANPDAQYQLIWPYSSVTPTKQSWHGCRWLCIDRFSSMIITQDLLSLFCQSVWLKGSICLYTCLGLILLVIGVPLHWCILAHFSPLKLPPLSYLADIDKDQYLHMSEFYYK